MPPTTNDDNVHKQSHSRKLPSCIDRHVTNRICLFLSIDLCQTDFRQIPVLHRRIYRRQEKTVHWESRILACSCRTYKKVNKARCCYWTSTPCNSDAGANATSYAFYTTYEIDSENSSLGHMSTPSLKSCEHYNGYVIRPVLLRLKPTNPYPVPSSATPAAPPDSWCAPSNTCASTRPLIRSPSPQAQTQAGGGNCTPAQPGLIYFAYLELYCHKTTNFAKNTRPCGDGIKQTTLPRPRPWALVS